MPKTKIYAGDMDPLYDDAVWYILLLIKNGGNGKINNFKYCSHGLLTKGI